MARNTEALDSIIGIDSFKQYASPEMIQALAKSVEVARNGTDSLLAVEHLASSIVEDQVLARRLRTEARDLYDPDRIGIATDKVRATDHVKKILGEAESEAQQRGRLVLPRDVLRIMLQDEVASRQRGAHSVNNLAHPNSHFFFDQTDHIPGAFESIGVDPAKMLEELNSELARKSQVTTRQTLVHSRI